MVKIIAAIRDASEMGKALLSELDTVFLLKSDIVTLPTVLNRFHNMGKKVYIHMDFADGVGKDSSGCLYLKNLGVDGIISTRTGIIKCAKENGITTVQRVFIVDSHSIATAVDTVEKTSPDMIELMPGIATQAISFCRQRVKTPIIAGGLIETFDEALEAQRAGADAVSTGNTFLWK